MRFFIIQGLILLSALVLSGCGKASDAKSQLPELNEYVLPKNDNAEISTFYYKEGTIVYAIDYASYFEYQMTAYDGSFRFTEDLNTEIHIYDVLKGTDRLVYRYDSSYPVTIVDIFVTDKRVYWQEYGADGFCIWTSSSSENGTYEDPQMILSSLDISDAGWLICPCLYDEILYWYEPNGDRYDLRGYENGHIYTYHDKVYLSSPFEVPLMSNGAYSYATKSEDGKIKIVSKKEGRDEIQIDCDLSDIGSVFSNHRFLAWKDGYYNEYLIQIYDLENQSFSTLDLDYFFSIGLIDDFLFADTKEEMILYRLPGLEKIDSREGRYLYIQQNDDGALFCENADTGGILVMECSK